MLTSEDLCEEKRLCVCMNVYVNEYESLSWWKKILNQLRISLAPSALFLLLIRVLCSAASPCKESWAYTRLEIWRCSLHIAFIDHLYIHLVIIYFIYWLVSEFMKKYALYKVSSATSDSWVSCPNTSGVLPSKDYSSRFKRETDP